MTLKFSTVAPDYELTSPQHTSVEFTDPLSIELQKLRNLQSKVGPDPLWINLNLTFDNQHLIIDLLTALPAQSVSVKKVLIRVEQGVRVDIKKERQLLRVIAEAPFEVVWGYVGLLPGLQSIPLDLGQLYYLSENGAANFDFCYSYELVKAIRENNVPWMLMFDDVVIQQGEMPDAPLPPVLTLWQRIKAGFWKLVETIGKHQ